MWLHVPRELLSASAPASEGSTSASSTPAEWSLWCTSSGKPSLRPALWPGWKKRSWHKLLSGTTCAPSTLDRGVDSWISSLAERHARTSAWPGSAPDSTESGAGCSSSTSASPSSVRPRFSSGRTSLEQLALFPASASTSRIEATAAHGPSFVRVTLEPPTNEPGSSCWPTPSASTYGNNRGGAAGRVGPIRQSLEGEARDWARENLWATASARDWKSGEHSEATGRRNARPLSEEAWAWAHSRLSALTSKGGRECLQYDPTLHRLCLTPAFVEWLMGWPEGWTLPYAQTDSALAETGWCPTKRPMPGAGCGRRYSEGTMPRTEP